MLLPLAVLIAHELRRTPDDRALQGASVAVVVVVAFVHPTYVFPLLAITTGLALLTRSGLRVLLATYAAGAAVLGWIWWEALAGAPRAEAFHPVYRSGISRVFQHTAMLSGTSILHHRAPFLLAMVAMPVLLVAFGRRWTLAAATMLGPFVLVALPGALALLVPIVNLAQARRFWIAVPWEFVAAVALALIAARMRGRWLAVAAVAAVVLSYLTRLRPAVAVDGQRDVPDGAGGRRLAGARRVADRARTAGARRGAADRGDAADAAAGGLHPGRAGAGARLPPQARQRQARSVARA